MNSDPDYIKKVLHQILDSYTTILKLQDQPGDLEIIKKELLKINGFFLVLVKKIVTPDIQSRDLLDLKKKISSFLENYYFIQEINTMKTLYSGDSDRLKNKRLKIIEAFQDKKLIDKINELSEQL